MRRRNILLWLLYSVVLWDNLMFGQNMGIGTKSPHPSSVLEIYSEERGILIPRLTTAQRNAINSPAHTLLIFNIETFCIETYDSISQQWISVACPLSCPPCDTVKCPIGQIDSIIIHNLPCKDDTLLITIYGDQGAYIWNIPPDWTMISQGVTSQFIVGDSAILYAHLCNECGCSSDSLFIFPYYKPDSVNILTSDSFCLLDTIIAVASGGDCYQWSVSPSLIILSASDTLYAIANDTGNYFIYASACNNCGCSNKDSSEITIWIDTGTISISGPSYVCLPDTITFYVSGMQGNTVRWNYPATWTLLHQDNDSITLIPDGTDGTVSVSVCSRTSCKCAYDSIYVITDTCLSFCMFLGDTLHERPREIILDNTGNYVIVGSTNSFGSGQWDVLVAKLDSFGNIIWTTALGGSSNDYGYDIVSTANNEYVVVGYSASFSSSGDGDCYVAKMDSAGNVIWTRTFGGPQEDVCWGITNSQDGGFVIVGSTNSFGNGNYDVLVLKIDSNGNLLWAKAIGGTQSEDGYAVIQTNDGGFLIVGRTASFGSGNYDVYVIKLSATGLVQWTRTIGGASNDWATDVTNTSDGGFLMAGVTFSSFGAGLTDIYAVKLDASGNLVWTKAYGTSLNESALKVITTIDNAYAIVAYHLPALPNNPDIVTLKIDDNGNILWTKTIGTDNPENTRAILQDNSGFYVVTGYAFNPQFQEEILIAKFDEAGTFRPCQQCQINSLSFSLNSGGNVSSGGNAINITPLVSSGGVQSSGGRKIDLCD